jgi:hypothetical protein
VDLQRRQVPQEAIDEEPLNDSLDPRDSPDPRRLAVRQDHGRRAFDEEDRGGTSDNGDSLNSNACEPFVERPERYDPNAGQQRAPTGLMEELFGESEADQRHAERAARGDHQDRASHDLELVLQRPRHVSAWRIVWQRHDPSLQTGAKRHRRPASGEA